MTTLDEAYQQLELQPDAPDEEVQRAHRDLAKVWHPDRFGNDPELRRRAEEKLKRINEAWETIRASREGRSHRWRPAGEEGDAAASVRLRQRRNRTWALTCATIGVFLLLRRPTPGGLAIALILFAVAVVLVMRAR